MLFWEISDHSRARARPFADRSRAVRSDLVLVAHYAGGIHPERQTRPHPHSIVPGPENRFVYAPDLGTDRIERYELDRERGTLEPVDSIVEIHAGAGPRHLAFAPDGRVAYCCNELDSTLTVLERDPETGGLESRQTVDTLPADFAGESTAAGVRVHPSGRWVYASNRGHDSVAVFARRGDGGLELRGHESTRGETPRNLALAPSDSRLFAANRHGDSVVGFRMDAETGSLEPTGLLAMVSRPACVLVLAR